MSPFFTSAIRSPRWRAWPMIMVILQDGKVVPVQGPTEEVLSDPAAMPFVGRAGGRAPSCAQQWLEHGPDGLSRLTISGGALFLPGVTAALKIPEIRIRVLAQDILLSLQRPESLSSRNILPVDGRRPCAWVTGPVRRFRLRAGSDDRLLARITAQAARELQLRRRVCACFAILKATAVPKGSIGAAKSSLKAACGFAMEKCATVYTIHADIM